MKKLFENFDNYEEISKNIKEALDKKACESIEDQKEVIGKEISEEFDEIEKEDEDEYDDLDDDLDDDEEEII